MELPSAATTSGAWKVTGVFVLADLRLDAGDAAGALVADGGADVAALVEAGA
ncbi:hypothetical protein GA0115255_104363, partial [Streptomyces sp. Ncost-T6T-2b]